MYQAGGRLFVDVTQELASPIKRDILVNVLGKSNPLIRDALMTILERGDFIQLEPNENTETGSGQSNQGTPPPNFQAQLENDPAIVSNLIRNSQELIEELKQTIKTKLGADLFETVRSRYTN
jgi:pyruvate,water dikinase